jgi:uroporphyrin-III C-methyltransferase/precorrin-2 dehydrogenase/sirohydrochlorin ferrochelatase
MNETFSIPSDLDELGRPPMHGLATLPLFFTLSGKRVVLSGGSPAALWKAELLQAAGAQLEIYSPDPDPRLRALARRCPSVRLIERACMPEDLAGAVLAVADVESSDGGEAPALRAGAAAAGVPLNMIDRPEESDFRFGAIVDRSPLVIGISTDGAAPKLAQALRGRLEALLPRDLAAWAEAAKAWRRKLAELRLPTEVRRGFWEHFASLALDARNRRPHEGDLDRLLTQVSETAKGVKGSVALVGAGPGDPELLTLKALRVLQSADVVLYDDLVAPGIVEMARREAEKISVGKRGYRPSCSQDQIVSLMVERALAGKRVVRLKGGDPMIFGRANEEIAGLEAAGITTEVVPGVTAALGAAASLKLSLTERDKARRVQFVTAHAHNGQLPDDLDWRSLCDKRASSVVYMGARMCGALAERLIAEGIDPVTPVIVVERATWADERAIHGTIATIAAEMEAANPAGPCIILIGWAFGAAISDDAAADERALVGSD